MWWRVVRLFNSSAAPRRSEQQSQTNLARVFSSHPLPSTSWRSVRTHRLLWSSYGRPPVLSALRYQTCCCNMKGRYFLVVLCAIVCTGRNMWLSLVDRYFHNGNATHIGIFQCAKLRVRVNGRGLQRRCHWQVCHRNSNVTVQLLPSNDWYSPFTS